VKILTIVELGCLEVLPANRCPTNQDSACKRVAALKVLGHTVPVREYATPQKAHTAAHIDFVLSELDLGATFCEVALSTRDKETKERNIRNARKAYTSALHFLQRLSLGNAEETRIEEKALRLKGLFERLGLGP
jgi:hypothetical protein